MHCRKFLQESIEVSSRNIDVDPSFLGDFCKQYCQNHQSKTKIVEVPNQVMELSCEFCRRHVLQHLNNQRSTNIPIDGGVSIQLTSKGQQFYIKYGINEDTCHSMLRFIKDPSRFFTEREDPVLEEQDMTFIVPYVIKKEERTSLFNLVFRIFDSIHVNEYSTYESEMKILMSFLSFFKKIEMEKDIDKEETFYEFKREVLSFAKDVNIIPFVGEMNEWKEADQARNNYVTEILEVIMGCSTHQPVYIEELRREWFEKQMGLICSLQKTCRNIDKDFPNVGGQASDFRVEIHKTIVKIMELDQHQDVIQTHSQYHTALKELMYRHIQMQGMAVKVWQYENWVNMHVRPKHCGHLQDAYDYIRYVCLRQCCHDIVQAIRDWCTLNQTLEDLAERPTQIKKSKKKKKRNVKVEQDEPEIVEKPELDEKPHTEDDEQEREETEGDDDDDDDIPHDLCCPITMALFQDPVMAADGHTYERKAIEDWFSKTNTSPLTQNTLINLQLIPNILVYRLVKKFKEEGGLD